MEVIMSKKNTDNSNSDPVDMKDLSDDVKSKLRDFDEQENQRSF